MSGSKNDDKAENLPEERRSSLLSFCKKLFYLRALFYVPQSLSVVAAASALSFFKGQEFVL